MKDKVFISHSSVWKTSVVEPLVELLGRDAAVVDKYNFESGEALIPQIRESIGQCRYFLLLISKEAIKPGGWVEKEIEYVRNLVDEGKVVFWACIIDPEVNWNDENIKTWIKSAYILDQIPTPITLSRLIKKKIRRDKTQQNPKILEKFQLYKGRDEETSKLKALIDDVMFEDSPQTVNTIIISGLKHLGRKRFLSEFLANVRKSNITPYDILTISLTQDNDAWILAHKLNELTGTYAILELERHISDDCIGLIAELIDTLRKSKEYVIIEDDGAIVLRNGCFQDWFVTLTKHPLLKNESLLHIISRFTPRVDIHSIFGNVIHLTLHQIEREWLKRICKAYADLSELSISEPVVDEIVDCAKGYPQPLYMAVNALKESGNRRKALNKALTQSLAGIENNFRTIVSEIKAENPAALSLLQILASTPFLSYSNLEEIWSENLDVVLDILESYCITEYSGQNNELISVNSGMADYIRRTEKIWNPDIKKRLVDYTSIQIMKLNSPEMDLGGYFLAKRELIRENINNIRPEDLIPSLVLKLINEAYYEHRDKDVITMAYQLLNGYDGKRWDLERQVRYKLCLALSREADPRFKTEINYFESDSFSACFLNGFYYRHLYGKNVGKTIMLQRAADYYMKAYNMRNQKEFEYDDAKLLHELWMVKNSLGDVDALNFAKECYEKRPQDKFHIEAYFQSLFNQPHKDMGLLQVLLQEMESIADEQDTVFLETMKAELQYCNNLDMKKLSDSIELILTQTPKQHLKGYPLRIFKGICTKQEALPIYNNLKRKFGDIDDSESSLFRE